MVFKIIHDKNKCIGCGACITMCPENWKFQGNKAQPIKKEIKEISCNQKAADICPVKCIKIQKK
ncbi:MAG TPA: ferredoxin [archaeon]|jgi:ferredoxin|nr:ferredoxin [archaeon]HPC10266.1 ferredoxin [archaeon]HRT03384.1 ferredoxin [Candidatus Diapherotrites archaeon]